MTHRHPPEAPEKGRETIIGHAQWWSPGPLPVRHPNAAVGSRYQVPASAHRPEYECRPLK
ncbi:hypothetical protein GCM10009755_21500 [Brevibacterium samyangense]|uniref:Uncharacterized protein n=1 Tax=Brevibacterium samyangense TaxID=366888 RepID=A0ABP5EW99_9MICO